MVELLLIVGWGGSVGVVVPGAADARGTGTVRWGIVGGGMLGSTVALRLAQAGHDVTLFEGAPQIGGLASAWRVGDVIWDRHYHVTLLSDSSLRALLKELGLEYQIEWVETKTGCYSDGELYSVSNTVEFLRFPPLRLWDKLRLGMTVLRAARLKDWKSLEQIDVETWLRTWSGNRAFERFWLPLLRSKLGEGYRDTSAAFIWAVIQRLYAARRTGLKKEMFGYVPGGYARVLERLGRFLESSGVDVRLGVRVRSVAAAGLGPVITTDDGHEHHFDRVLVTTASPLAARLIEGMNDSEREAHLAVRYQGVVCASILTSRPLAGFYVTNITDEAPFTGVIEMTALVDPEEFGGRSLVYLPKYLPPGDSLFEVSDEEIRGEFLAGLARMFPTFDEGEIEAFQVSRVRHVLPIATVGFSERLPAAATSVPDVWVVNSAHILNGTLNVNETVELAERTARSLLEEAAVAPVQAGVIS
ncbi:MAG: NAD(P)/FAD-dependent oxidoreductase [Acidimicrobiia bacterium]